ncbi:GTPase inhibitor [Cryptococcus neoformans]|nr:GTPase inhibitor [Cryptococcus neoformans var. grubii Bt1]OXG22907.1 GTPase inhibitor [Cryptococcus neoformans var. grubii Ze90-1]OXH30436.1 GTPase inhibitor [Cryptococcus neoformans var. grubii]
MVNPDEDTEFNDALRRHGILPPKPPSRSPSPDIPHITHTDAVRAVAATADADQLVTLIEGDNVDSDDERMFEEYKRKRLHEMKKEEKKGRFGSMEPLGREDFVKEVTEGSKADPDGEQIEDQDDDDEESSPRLKGTGVVVFLFKDSVPLSQHLRPLLNQAAAAHPSTKFLSIPAGLCIPNYPDKNVPTLLIYRNGEMIGNVVAGMGLKGMKTTVRDLEGLLLYFKAVEKPSAALLRSSEAIERLDSDDDFNDDVGTVNTRGGGLRTGGVGIGAGRGKEDSDDSDFDM